MDHPRPDRTLSPGPYNQYTNLIQAQIALQDGRPFGTGNTVRGPQGANTVAVAPPVTVYQQPKPWTPNTFYMLGSQVTATNPVGYQAAGEDISVFLCIVPGTSSIEEPWLGFAIGLSAIGVGAIEGLPAYIPPGPDLPGFTIGVSGIGLAPIEAGPPQPLSNGPPFNWTDRQGVVVPDGSVVWMNAGRYLP